MPDKLSDFPAIHTVVPHKPPMILIHHILSFGEESITCDVHLGRPSLFTRPDGTVPAWVGLEYAAQTVAAYAGMDAEGKGGTPKIGFLIGARTFTSNTSEFNQNQVLEIKATLLFSDEQLGVFECSIKDRSTKKILSHGKLNVFQPEDLQTFLKQHE